MATEPITDAEFYRAVDTIEAKWAEEGLSGAEIKGLFDALRHARAEHKAYVSLMVGTLADLGRETADIEAERDAARAELQSLRHAEASTLRAESAMRWLAQKERDAALTECADVRAEHEKTRSAWAVLDKLTFKLMDERDAARAENAKLRDDLDRLLRASEQIADEGDTAPWGKFKTLQAEHDRLRAQYAELSNALTPIDEAPPLCSSEKG